MSDRRVRGTPEAGRDSGTDQPSDSSGESTLGAVGQEAGSAGGSGITGSGSHGGGALTSPSSSSKKEDAGLGARPRAVGGGRKSGKGGGKSGRSGDDVWSNRGRKSAKTLRGRGQELRARRDATQRAAEACSVRSEPPTSSSLSMVHHDLDPHDECAENDPCVSFMSRLLLLFLPIGALLLSDLSRDWDNSAVSTITGHSREEALNWAVSFAVAFTCFVSVFVVVLLRIMCAGENRGRRR
ncbi:hypothetical protein [Candidatus Ichthyocystis sparus]|uniref:hypothetical protein n=1 Tax=Candidatus Ichthyocystis sparus TaxID=1561004 RepID=UPI000B88AF95|nr:hypothetical protein [Candidatus Ichthyocystis sparus]